jgi:hypothetical protein
MPFMLAYAQRPSQSQQEFHAAVPVVVALPVEVVGDEGVGEVGEDVGDDFETVCEAGVADEGPSGRRRLRCRGPRSR